MKTLHARHLAKSYKRRRVVHDISLEIGQGHITGLLGPNGAGKTTSFYMIVGLVRADAGQVAIDDLDLSDAAMHERAHAGIGYLPRKPRSSASSAWPTTSWPFSRPARISTAPAVATAGIAAGRLPHHPHPPQHRHEPVRG